MTIDGLFNQTITISSKSGYSSDGREQVGTATSVSARFQAQTKRKLLPDGSLLLIEAIAYVPASTTVSTDDKITYDGNNYKVVGKYAAVDGEGDTNHIKLELVKWQQ